jgi:rhamnosyl/mannosyltransferase
MNIVHANKYYHPVVGGVETVVKTLAEGMAERGHAATVVTARPRGFGTTEQVGGVNVVRTSSLGSVASVPIAPTFPLRLREQYADASIIHHHVPNPLGTVGDVIQSSECPTVATYHSDIVRQSRLLTIYRPILERFLDNLDRIFVTSPRLLEHSEFLRPRAEKCTVVPLSIDITAHREATVDPFSLPGSVDRPTVLFVGRLNYYKGVEHLVDAVDHVETEADFLIVGDGPRAESLHRRASEIERSDRVHFLGYRSRPELEYCYEQADVFVLPSTEPSEAFGIVQLEAMIHETPVVNTSLPTGVPWVSRDGETGRTVDPADSLALATALDDLLANPEKRRRYGVAAKRRVEEHFGRSDMLDTVEQEYERLVE